MPLFKNTIIEQVSPSTYALFMERVDQYIVAPINKGYTLHSLSLYQESLATFVEGNGLYILSSLFLLCAIVTCVFGRPVASPPEVVELKSPPKLHRKVPASISMDDSEVTELTAELMSSSSSSSSSASSTSNEDANDDDDDDAISTASSVECPEDDEDDHSVEETYDEFLKFIASDDMDGEVVGQVFEAKVFFNDSDEDTALETPTSSPSSTPNRSYADVAATTPVVVVAEDDAKSVSTTNTTSSRRASLKKRLSSSFKRTSSNSSLTGMFKRNSSSSSLSGMVKKSTSRLSLRKLDTTQENKE